MGLNDPGDFGTIRHDGPSKQGIVLSNYSIIAAARIRTPFPSTGTPAATTRKIATPCYNHRDEIVTENRP
jgi:hypothetical protein